MEIISGTGKGQAKLVSDWDLSTKVLTVTPNLVTVTDNTSKYVIHTNSGILQSSGKAQSAILSASTANTNDNYYRDQFIKILSGDGRWHTYKHL